MFPPIVPDFSVTAVVSRQALGVHLSGSTCGWHPSFCSATACARRTAATVALSVTCGTAEPAYAPLLEASRFAGSALAFFACRTTNAPRQHDGRGESITELRLGLASRPPPSHLPLTVHPPASTSHQSPAPTPTPTPTPTPHTHHHLYPLASLSPAGPQRMYVGYHVGGDGSLPAAAPALLRYKAVRDPTVAFYDAWVPPPLPLPFRPSPCPLNNADINRETHGGPGGMPDPSMRVTVPAAVDAIHLHGLNGTQTLHLSQATKTRRLDGCADGEQDGQEQGKDCGEVCGVTCPIQDTIQNPGPSNDRPNLVFLSAGYTLAEKDSFTQTIYRSLEMMASTRPYSGFSAAFNVFSVFIPDATSGVSAPSRGLITDNVLQCSFGDYWRAPEKVLQCSYYLTSSYAAMAPIPYEHVDLMIVIANNQDIMGGLAGAGMVTMYSGQASSDVLMHGMGHAWAGLNDEYDYYFGDADLSLDYINCVPDNAGALPEIWAAWTDPEGEGGCQPRFRDYTSSDITGAPRSTPVPPPELVPPIVTPVPATGGPASTSSGSQVAQSKVHVQEVRHVITGADANDAYLIQPAGGSSPSNNPDVVAYRDELLVFQFEQALPDHPFEIQNQDGTAYTGAPVTGQGNTDNTVQVTIPADEIATELRYQCTSHAAMNGKILIQDRLTSTLVPPQAIPVVPLSPPVSPPEKIALPNVLAWPQPLVPTLRQVFWDEGSCINNSPDRIRETVGSAEQTCGFLNYRRPTTGSCMMRGFVRDGNLNWDPRDYCPICRHLDCLPREALIEQMFFQASASGSATISTKTHGLQDPAAPTVRGPFDFLSPTCPRQQQLVQLDKDENNSYHSIDLTLNKYLNWRRMSASWESDSGLDLADQNRKTDRDQATLTVSAADLQAAGVGEQSPVTITASVRPYEYFADGILATVEIAPNTLVNLTSAESSEPSGTDASSKVHTLEVRHVITGADANDAYLIQPAGGSSPSNNPDVVAYRDELLVFQFEQALPDHPFEIQNQDGTAYTGAPVTGQGNTDNTVQVTIPADEIATELRYQCTSHAAMNGKILIQDRPATPVPAPSVPSPPAADFDPDQLYRGVCDTYAELYTTGFWQEWIYKCESPDCGNITNVNNAYNPPEVWPSNTGQGYIKSLGAILFIIPVIIVIIIMIIVLCIWNCCKVKDKVRESKKLKVYEFHPQQSALAVSLYCLIGFIMVGLVEDFVDDTDVIQTNPQLAFEYKDLILRGNPTHEMIRDIWVDNVDSQPGLVCDLQSRWGCSGFDVPCNNIEHGQCVQGCSSNIYSQACYFKVSEVYERHFVLFMSVSWSFVAQFLVLIAVFIILGVSWYLESKRRKDDDERDARGEPFGAGACGGNDSSSDGEGASSDEGRGGAFGGSDGGGFQTSDEEAPSPAAPAGEMDHPGSDGSRSATPEDPHDQPGSGSDAEEFTGLGPASGKSKPFEWGNPDDDVSDVSVPNGS
eukprot:gene3360-2_t